MCGVEVYWSAQALTSHKRKKCVESEIANEMWWDLEKFTSVEPCDEQNSSEIQEIEEDPEATTEPKKKVKEIRVTSTDIISEYLQDKDTSTRSLKSYSCFCCMFLTLISP